MDNSSFNGCYSYVGVRDTERELLVISAPISAVSLLLYLVVVMLLLALKLYKKLIYRLAFYQVLSAMGICFMWIVTATGNVVSSSFPSIAFEALLIGTTFVKLMFTVWISIHLFLLAVLHKNVQSIRFEILYVGTSLLLPLVITFALLVVNLKVHSPTYGSICFRESVIYCVLFTALFMASSLIIIMGAVLYRRAYRGRTIVLSEYDKQHKKALYEMQPLMAYPLLFFILVLPIFVIAVINLNDNDFNYTSYLSSLLFAILSPIWSFTTSLLLILHILIVRRIKKQKRLQKRKPALYTEERATWCETTQFDRSDTYYSSPVED